MTQPKQKKNEPVDDKEKERDRPTGPGSDPEKVKPEEIEFPGKDRPNKVLEQMQHADGSDTAVQDRNNKEPVVGFDDTMNADRES